MAEKAWSRADHAAAASGINLLREIHREFDAVRPESSPNEPIVRILR